MEDERRRRIYNNKDLTKEKGGTAKRRKEAQKKEMGSWGTRGVGGSRPQARGPFSLGRWAARFCVFSPLKQVVTSSKPQLLDSLSTNSL